MILSRLSPTLIIIITLVTLLSGTGYLLKQAYKSNGELETQVNAWQVATEAANNAYIALNDKLSKRDNQYRLLLAKNKRSQSEIRSIKDETNCLDTVHPVGVGLLLNPDYSRLSE